MNHGVVSESFPFQGDTEWPLKGEHHLKEMDKNRRTCDIKNLKTRIKNVQLSFMKSSAVAPATAGGDKYSRPCKGFVVLVAWELHH